MNPTMEAEVRPSSSQPPPSTTSIYTALQAYNFAADPEFQAGLTSLASNPSLSAEDLQETVFQAQCFYFARRYNLPLLDAADYKRWLQSSAQRIPDTRAPPGVAAATLQPGIEQDYPTHIAAQPLSQPIPEAPSTAAAAAEPSPSSSSAEKTDSGPPYPASFESIVDLITRNQPIPGIEEIPDTVLDASLSAPNQTARRKKPWETDEDVTKEVEPVLGDAVVKGQDGRPTGIVGILQPIKKLQEGEGKNPGAVETNHSEPKGTAT